MKNMKMKTKMILGFIVPVVLMIINVAVGMLSVRSINNEVNNMITNEVTFINEKMIEIGANEEKAQIIIDTLNESNEDEIAKINNQANLTNIINLVMVVVSVLLVFGIALSLIKQIARSVAQLSSAAKDIAAGRVDIEMVKYNNDEFGELVDEYTKVIDNIKTQADIAEEVSKGNLTITVTPSSPDDVLGNSLKKLVEDNLNALSSISDAGSRVTLSSSQVASTSQTLAQGSTQQASAIQQITASIDEIADKTKENADQANEAADLVIRAINDVKKGNAQMKETIVAMEDINKSSESIAKIIKVIDDIAFQTNILALNAAVEAARAGEAGKRFCRCGRRSPQPGSKECRGVCGDRRLDRELDYEGAVRFSDFGRCSKSNGSDYDSRTGKRRDHQRYCRIFELSGYGSWTDRAGDHTGIPGCSEQLGS